MSTEELKGVKAVAVKSRADWRKWLDRNHDKQKSVRLIMYRQGSGKAVMTTSEAVEEALCYGWIDSTANKRDDESYYLLFAQRKPKSGWSKVNKGRVERLIKAGLMKPAGMRMIKLAQETGTWDLFSSIDEMEIPADLVKAFRRNKRAKEHFDSFPPSAKKVILGWIQSAKRPETREKRVAEVVAKAEENIRANQYVKK